MSFKEEAVTDDDDDLLGLAARGWITTHTYIVLHTYVLLLDVLKVGTIHIWLTPLWLQWLMRPQLADFI